MRLKHGKKYETADGVVYRVVLRETGMSFEVSPEDHNQWRSDGTSMRCDATDLIRRHYTKPQPAHKLDLKLGDVVELVAWEDGFDKCIAEHITVTNGASILSSHRKGERPLFRVVSRASYLKPPS